MEYLTEKNIQRKDI